MSNPENMGEKELLNKAIQARIDMITWWVLPTDPLFKTQFQGIHLLTATFLKRCYYCILSRGNFMK